MISMVKKFVQSTARGIDGQTINSDGTEVNSRDVEYATMITVLFWVFINITVVFLSTYIQNVIMYIANIAAIMLYMAAVSEVANLKLKIIKLSRT